MATKKLRVFGFIFASMVVLGTSSGAIEGTDDLRSKARQLEAQCRSYFGIGLVDLSVLSDARAGSILLESSLAEHHRLESVDKLVQRGLAKVSRSTAGSDTFIQIVPTEAGMAIVSEISSVEGSPH